MQPLPIDTESSEKMRTAKKSLSCGNGMARLRRSITSVQSGGRLLCALGALLLAVSGAYGDVVHRASTDLVLNQDRVTPYTNALGGVWSTWCCEAGKLGDTASRTAMATRQTHGGMVGLGWEAADQHYGVPYALVNPKASDINNTGLTGGMTSPIHPGELLLHPGLDGIYGIVRFTVPRTGRYSVRFTYRTLVPDTGSVNAYAVTNGVTVFSKMLQRSQRTDAYSVYATNDLAETSFAAGDVIETALEMNGNISCDGVLVDMIVTERDAEGLWYDPIAAECRHAVTNTSYIGYSYLGPRGERYQVLAGFGADDATGGRLGIDAYARFVDSGSVTTRVETNIVGAVTNIVTTVTTNGPVLVGWSTRGDSFAPYPIAYVNTNEVPFFERTNIDSNHALQPDEMLFHPGQRYPSIHHAFFPEAAGSFDIGVQARDLNCRSGTLLSGSGVRVCLMRDCDILIERTIALEDDDLPSATTLFLTNVFLFARQRLDLTIDNNGSIVNDATGIRWFIRRRATGLPGGAVSANAAFAAEVQTAAPVLPFEDAQGFTWDAGKMTAVNKMPDPTTFTRHAATKTSNGNAFKGWMTSSRPFALSYLGTDLFSARNFVPFGGSEGNGEIVPGELMVHPGDSFVYGVVRATVPRDGVWDLHALFRHINNVGDGLDATVLLNGQRFAARARQVLNDSGFRLEGAFDCAALTLKANDTVDFIVGPGPSGSYACDLTGVQACFTESAQTGRVVSVDFVGASGAVPFSGPGRLGGGEVGAWNTLAVEQGATVAAKGDLWVDGHAARTGVSVTLTPTHDPFTAEAAGTTGCALLDDGLGFPNVTNVCAFTVAGLTPGASYTLCVYGRGAGLVRIGSRTCRVRESWFSAGSDLALLPVSADAAGCVTGTFRAFNNWTPAVFAGLQICGTSFSEYVPRRTIIIIR